MSTVEWEIDTSDRRCAVLVVDLDAWEAYRLRTVPGLLAQFTAGLYVAARRAGCGEWQVWGPSELVAWAEGVK